MKKFLVLPIVAALAACSSDNDKVAVPLQPQPVLTTSHSGHTETPKKEAEIQPNPKPVTSAPVYAPHNPSVSSSHLPTLPVVPTLPQPPVAPQPKAESAPVAASNPEVQQIVQKVFQPIISEDGELELPTPQWEGSSRDDGQTGYDAGMNGLKEELISNKVFTSKKGYMKGSAQLYLIDPIAAGFYYQTFGQVFDGSNSKGYISTGNQFTPKDTDTLNFKYKGGAMGTFDGTSEVVSDMTAALKWGTDEKSLTVDVTNSHISENNIKSGKFTGLTKDARFDFNETAQWSDADKKFKSTALEGYLYGDAEDSEVGGTFQKTIESKKYLGAFGGVVKLND